MIDVPYYPIMEAWAGEWLKERRAAGEKGLEIKKIGSGYYVYRSAMTWDKESKKRRKRSVYLGRLEEGKGLLAKEEKAKPQGPREIKQYGNAVLLNRVMDDLLPSLRAAFPEHWQSLYALSLVRVAGMVPLRSAQGAWSKLYNVKSLEPRMEANALARMLREVGADRNAQAKVFNSLCVNGEEVVYDLRMLFTRSGQVDLTHGQRQEGSYIQEIDLALLVSVDTGFPTMIRAYHEPAFDGTALGRSIKEVGTEGKVLLLDRGLFSEALLDMLDMDTVSYLIPAKRESDYQEAKVPLLRHFFHRKRLIKCGKTTLEGRFVYRFEDTQLKMEEEMSLYQLLDRGSISLTEMREASAWAGSLTLVSNRDLPEQEAYARYRSRDGVEALFDTQRRTMLEDRTLLKDADAIYGHIFSAFLSTYAYCGIESILRRNGKIEELTPAEVLDELSRTYWIQYAEGGQMAEVPKDSRKMEAELGIEVFPR